MHKSIAALAKAGLVARMSGTKGVRYDGYRLTYGGLDYLALHAHSSRGEVYSVGSRIGVGKESDIMIVASNTGQQRVLKIHRLGRVSFRTVKANRDYLRQGRRSTGSWMYLSRLAAVKEYAFMRALHDEGFPVPEPFSQSRHTILMELVDAPPLRKVSAEDVPDPAALYAELVALLLRLAQHGLIHGDFNEFNILLKFETRKPLPSNDGTDHASSTTKEEDAGGGAATDVPKEGGVSAAEKADATVPVPILIDFPQMVSMDHPDAETYFDRDVNCIKRFFERRFHFVPTQPGPFYKDAKKMVGKGGAKRLDAVLEASGFTKKMSRDLETAMIEQAGKAEPESGDEMQSEEDEIEASDDMESIDGDDVARSDDERKDS